jgi:antitoxin VapB
VAVTKIFWSGRSQAVRIPKEFRLQGTEAVIRRVGGSLVIEPIAADWAWIDRAHSAGGLDVEAEEAAVEHVPMAERSAAETYFSR